MEKSNETVTVAIPVYNGEKYISDTLQSILNQTRKVDRILICDNRSTDKTIQFIERIRKENPDFNFQIRINEKNLGHRKNFNKCFQLCNDDYLLITSCDDLLKPDAIEKQLAFFAKHPEVAVVAGKYDTVDEKGNLIRPGVRTETVIYKKGEILKFLVETDSWIHQSISLMRMKYIRKIGPFDERYLGFDELYWPKVLQQYAIALLGDILLEMREHTNQDGSLAYVRKYKEELKYLRAKRETARYEKDPEKVKQAYKVMNKSIYESSFRMGYIVWKYYNKKLLTIKYWFFAIRHYPASLRKKIFYRNLFNIIIRSK